MVLLQDSSVFSQEPLLLDFDDGFLTFLLLSLKLLLSKLSLTLLLVNSKFLLPEAFDLSLVFQFAHAASLGIHLLQTVILGKLLHKLALELLFHAFLFLSSFSLESELVLAGSLQFFTNTHSLLCLGSLLGLSGLFALLNVKLISELLLKGLLGSTLLLFSRKLLEDLVTDGFGFLLHGVDLILTSLLLLGISADHFILVLIHLSLAFQESPLLVLRKNHISLALLFLLLDDAILFIIFFDHALNDSVDLFLFSQVLLVSLLTGNICIINLSLNGALV